MLPKSFYEKPVTKIITAVLVMLSVQSHAQYLPLTGGTLSGNLTLSSNVQIQGSYYGFNIPALQPSSSSNTSIFTNNSTSTLDFVGWNNGWRFIPVNGSTYASPVLTIDPLGNTNISANTYIGKNLGIGTTSPNSTIDIRGYLSIGGTTGNLDPRDPPGTLPYLANTGQMVIGWNTSGGAGEADFISNQAGGGNGGFAFYNHDNSNKETQLMWLLANGNLLIGKTVPQTNSAYKLDVGGNVRANAITVNTSGADFVFDPVYKLMPLVDLSKYLNANHHLPGIASAKQMQADGVNLGDNQT
ncbi:hypothetical protein HDF19_13270 [Mucilaginibacter sp. E4BP6]|uniref:hypothetical protein n=1 Tax=Mucilaginibacter sp. E4BP6 TaxID=2723089 RepID=UPI0015CC5E35|nr:hypothetical protein [Mucilaginibacter sp. E4BP6]NYE66050.1 hypothetical protein [Mucilaginibacter sp. E4BP6]